MKTYVAADLFNDSLGPIMCGPSSSHTGGPARVGRLARDLCGGSFKSVAIQFCENTSFAKGYKSMGSDKGLYGGLMGWSPDNKELYNAVDIANQKGLNIKIEILDEEAEQDNAIWFQCETESGFRFSARMVSIGGASVEIVDIDGLPVLLTGGRYELVVWGNSDVRGGIETILGRAGAFANERLSVFSLPEKIDIEHIRSIKGVIYATVVDPVLPCVILDERNVLFSSAGELLKWLEGKPMDIADAAFAYQQAISGWDKRQVYNYAKSLMEAMSGSIEEGLRDDGRGFFCLRPVSGKMKDRWESKSFIPMGVIERASVYAQAVSEANMSMRRLVAAPTGGSAGVIPGAVLSCAREGDFGEEKTINALMVAALIGAFIFTRATFSGYHGGCSAEIGSASGMSAAAVAYLYGADTETCLKAAGIAIQNLIGLACDKLASGVELPCIQRNALGSANAILSANMAMCGVDPYLPLDETIDAAYQYSSFCAKAIHDGGVKDNCGISGSPTARLVRRRFEAD